MKTFSWLTMGCLVAAGSLSAGLGCDSGSLSGLDTTPPGKGPNEEGPDASAGPVPGGTSEDEQFPVSLLAPYTGPAIDYYDNTFINAPQLRARIDHVFADTAIGGTSTDAYFVAKGALFGSADFKTRFTEARTASSDFLLALDELAKNACNRAATNKTGPFVGIDAATIAAGAEDAPLNQLTQKMLFRGAAAQEITDYKKMLTDLKAVGSTGVDAWAAVCETLVRSPDSLFTLPPSVTTASATDKPRLQLVKLGNDFLGRPPTEKEFGDLAGKTVDEVSDYFMGLPEFRDYYFSRIRLRTESVGTPESDEAARLWTYTAIQGKPFSDILSADYTVDTNFAQATRPAYHGKTGILTMKGFINSKPGLPHYNYSARVLIDYMGKVFVLPDDIAQMRMNKTASSTVDPTSSCFTCHSMLTPLAYQRTAWADDGTYTPNDADGKPIDDTDHNLVPEASYPYRGKGMEAFATKAIKKEAFLRSIFQAQYTLLYGRPMRYTDDERVMYYRLWKSAFDANLQFTGNFKIMMKTMVNNPSYLGQ